MKSTPRQTFKNRKRSILELQESLFPENELPFNLILDACPDSDRLLQEELDRRAFEQQQS